MNKIMILLLLITNLLFARIEDANEALENKEYKKAIDLLKDIAYDGMVAKYKLAQMHEFGWGVQKDIKKAIFIYSLSANDGYAPARNRLGNIYYEGIVVKKDVKLAKRFHQLAAQQGNENSIEVLKKLDLTNKKDTNKKLAYITVRSNVDDDMVFVNDKYMGSTKITIPIKADEIYKIRVEKAGWTTYSFRDVKLKAGQKKSILGILKKEK